MCGAALPYILTMWQAFQKNQQAIAQKKVAQYNARVQSNQAEQVKKQGVQEELKQRYKTQQLVGQQRAAAAASGADVNTGTTIALQEEAEQIGMQEASQIRENYQNRYDALKTQSQITLIEANNRARVTRDRATAGLAQSWYKESL